MRKAFGVFFGSIGLLQFCAPAVASQCTELETVTLHGTVSKTEVQPLVVGSAINLYIADPELDCSPVSVRATEDNTCEVGERVTVSGFLARDEAGLWILVGSNPFGETLSCEK